jgi:predicted RNase H-like nuclease (RuvC/YqgF family)
MATAPEPSLDSLASLEERITRAVRVITDLRSQNAQMALRISSLEDALKKAQSSQDEKAELEQTAQRLAEEVTELRDERKQVRIRIEKLLGQLELLTAS